MEHYTLKKESKPKTKDASTQADVPTALQMELENMKLHMEEYWHQHLSVEQQLKF